MDNTYWHTLSDMSRHLNVSVRTIQRHIKQGKYKTKIEDGRRLVYLEGVTADDIASDDVDDMSLLEPREQILYLQRQNQHLSRQLEDMTGQLSDANTRMDEASKRSDTIILQVTRQLDRMHLQIEDIRRRRTLWQRFRAVFIAQETV